MTLRVLGVDPGPSLTGFALLQFGDDGGDDAVMFVDGDHVPSTVERAMTWLLGHAVDVVAIETAQGFGNIRFNPDPVIQGARVGGGIEWLALSRGIEVVAKTAQHARGELSRRANASDAMVAVVVHDLVGGVCIANPHVRDACAVAAAVGYERLGWHPKLSQSAERRLLELAAKRRERVQEKRARLKAHRTA